MRWVTVTALQIQAPGSPHQVDQHRPVPLRPQRPTDSALPGLGHRGGHGEGLLCPERLCGRREASRVRWSGCSAVTCILESSVESPEARRSWGRISDLAALADRHLFPGMPQITTGVLHIANAGMYIECGRLHLNMFYSWQQNLSCFQNYLLIYYLMTFSCLDISLTSLRNDQQPQFRFRLQAQHEL